MTFKSIETILNEHGAANRLVLFVPPMDPDQSDVREIWMAPGLHQWIYQKDRKRSIDFKSRIRAHLKVFVVGKQIDNCDYMKCWDKNVWEIRTKFENRRDESTRIFGTFVEADKFIAVFWKFRSYFGDRHDPKWDAALDRVLREWQTLFSTLPLASQPFSGCVTSNAIDYK